MRTEDHRRLSVYMAERGGVKISRFLKLVFVFGSIEPDFNLFTYLRGCMRDRKPRGHNYENIQRCMVRLATRLERGLMGSVRYYYNLGRLIHYVADSFTYPHNSSFTGNLREHCEYERQLHVYMKIMLESDRVTFGTGDEESSFMKTLTQLHDSYDRECHVYMTDYCYIVYAVSMAYERYAERIEEPQRSVDMEPLSESGFSVA